MSASGDFEGVVNEALAKLGRSRQVNFVASLFSTLAQVLRQSKRIATMPSLPAQAYAQCFGLAASPLPFPMEGFSYQMLWHPRVDNNPAQRWLRAHARALAAALKKSQMQTSGGLEARDPGRARKGRAHLPPALARGAHLPSFASAQRRAAGGALCDPSRGGCVHTLGTPALRHAPSPGNRRDPRHRGATAAGRRATPTIRFCKPRWRELLRGMRSPGGDALANPVKLERRKPCF